MIEKKELPKGWIQVGLSELFLDPTKNIVDGPFGSNLKASEYKEEGIPVIRIQNIDRNRFIDKNINYVTEEKAEFLSRHSFKSGDIIITKLGAPLGKACFVPPKYDEGIIVADLVRLRVDNENISPQFLVYQLNSGLLIKQFDQNTKGTTRPRIKLSVIRNLKFNIPPLNEQNRIVAKIEELFSDLENGIEGLKLAKQQLKIYRQTLFQDAFEGKLTQQWREKNNPESAENIAKRIREEKLNLYQVKYLEWKDLVRAWELDGKSGQKPLKPKKLMPLTRLFPDEKLAKLPSVWKWIKIGEFEDLISSGSTPKGGKDTYTNHGVPFIRSMNVYPNKLVLDGLVYIDEQTHKKMTRSQLNEKDVLINITGASIGRCTFVPKGFGDGNVNQHVCIIRSFTTDIYYKYLCYYLNSPEAQKIIQKINSGATREALTFDQIRNFPFPLTSLEEQQLIILELESQLSIIDNLGEVVEQHIQKSKTLRQSILKKAFQGRLTYQNSGDESAEKLLERIKSERDFHEKEPVIKTSTNITMMSKNLSIEDILKISNKPMLTKDVWQQSMHKDNIEEFYAELKKIQEKIKEVKKGTESTLILTK